MEMKFQPDNWFLLLIEDLILNLGEGGAGEGRDGGRAGVKTILGYSKGLVLVQGYAPGLPRKPQLTE